MPEVMLMDSLFLAFLQLGLPARTDDQNLTGIKRQTFW